MQHDFTLAANASTTIDVAGRFFKYKSGSGLIRIRATKGGYIDLMPGQGVEDEEFTSLTVIDRTGQPNAGVILAGNFHFRDETISGVVQVIDGGKSRTLANASFLGYQNAGSSVGNYGHVQLFNPAGSGKNVFVSRVTVSSTAASPNSPRFTFYNVALTNSTQKALSKKNGGGLSTADINTGFNAVILGAATVMFGSFISPNTGAGIDLKEPIMLPPGTGLCAVAGAVNSDMPATFDFYEEPI